MPQVLSIDNFINQHRNDELIEQCGKLAIVRSILEAESQSSLFVDPSNIYNTIEFGIVENTWFTRFWKLLTENCSRLELEQRFKSVVFVIFNYDRCIEHYLYYALQNTYRMSSTDAAELIEHIEIYHPYGTVGALPWQSHDSSIQYGGTPNSQELLMLAGKIKTFTEGTDELSSDVVSIRSNMKASHRIVFLGFAFHRLNMDLLLSTTTSKAAALHIFATAYEISTHDTISISGELVARGAGEAKIQIRNDLKCSEIFQEYWRSLSFSLRMQRSKCQN